jgi:O-methyltransferase domain
MSVQTRRQALGPKADGAIDGVPRAVVANCRRAIPPHGRLLIVEMILPEPNKALPGRLLDLIMLANSPSGRERTLGDYEDLLVRAEFRLERVVATALPVSVIEAIPA